MQTKTAQLRAGQDGLETVTVCYAIPLPQEVTSCLVKWEFLHNKDEHKMVISSPCQNLSHPLLAGSYAQIILVHITALAQINSPHLYNSHPTHWLEN